MPIRGPGDHERTAVSLLATSLVCLLGFLGTAAIAFLGSGDPRQALLMSGGWIILAAGLLWLLRDKPPNRAAQRHFYWLTRKKPPSELHKYRPRRRPYQVREFGTNEPPTPERIRELKEGLHNWTPSGSPPRRRSGPGRA